MWISLRTVWTLPILLYLSFKSCNSIVCTQETGATWGTWGRQRYSPGLDRNGAGLMENFRSSRSRQKRLSQNSSEYVTSLYLDSWVTLQTCILNRAFKVWFFKYLDPHGYSWGSCPPQKKQLNVIPAHWLRIKMTNFCEDSLLCKWLPLILILRDISSTLVPTEALQKSSFMEQLFNMMQRGACTHICECGKEIPLSFGNVEKNKGLLLFPNKGHLSGCTHDTAVLS